METIFSKFSNNKFPDQWARFFHAGTDWFMLCEILKEKPQNTFFYVWPFATGITIELFVKAIVAYEYHSFNPQEKRYGHHTTNIINDYKNSIPVLDEISKNIHLMEVIKSYEETINTRFGDTSISINGDDEEKVLDAAWRIREAVRVKAGFNN